LTHTAVYRRLGALSAAAFLGSHATCVLGFIKNGINFFDR
jgi:hypothetical protein